MIDIALKALALTALANIAIGAVRRRWPRLHGEQPVSCRAT